MNDAVTGTLIGVVVGAVLGWGLPHGTEMIRRRRRDNVALRRFRREIVAILHQAQRAVDSLDTMLFSGNKDENPAYDHAISLPRIETFSEISNVLRIKEMEFAASAVQYWNYRRRVEPGGIPDSSALKDLIELVGHRIFLRKPFAWILHPKESERRSSRIQELISSPPEPDSELENNESAE
jgi:hypothetical protein